MSSPAFEIPGYELVRELGAGGMATVFLAVQRSLERKVAIKIMRRGLTDENVEKRFLMEGRTMARLPHPNIVGVYDIVQNESINYIAMEFLEGGMLSDRMREGLTLAEAISVVVQIAGALQYAHDNNIVHRDLKPSNIMFRDAVTPVLTDFGIAKAQKSEGATRLTQTGMMIGTPTYMSPEQATGSELDGRSDQYALGVLFFEMLTGSAPFEGSTPIQVVLAHLNTPPPPLPPQFAFFQPLMDRMLAKDREQRYPDLKIFVTELKRLLTGSESLLQKLHIDPNQSASEQLRALGFSESQIHTGSGISPQPRSSGQHRAAPAPPKKRPTGSGPGVRLGDREEAGEGGRPPWLIPAAAAGALVLALGIGWALFGGGDDAGQQLDPAMEMIIRRDLDAVDKLIAEGKLISPLGDNAFERLQQINQVTARSVERYGPAEERLARIASLLREQAQTALQAGQFDEAERRVQESLAVLPENADSTALAERISQAKRSAELEAEVAQWIATAAEAQRAGRLYGEGKDTALAALRRALEIDPNSSPAKQAMQALVAQALRPAEQSLAAGKLDEAQATLTQAAPFIGGESAWLALNTQLEQAARAQQMKARIDSLLSLAKRQLAAGRIAEPAGDNTLETLQRIFEIDPRQADALALQAQAADSLVKSARSAEQAGDFSLALSRYDQALKADPKDSAAASARQALEQRVGERQAAISRSLAAARDAIAGRVYFPPSRNNAYDLLREVLQQDRDNRIASQLLGDLPKLSRESAQAMADEGKSAEALELLKQAQAIYKNDAQIALLASRISARRDAEKQAAKREELLADLRAEWSKRKLDPDSARAISFAIKELLALDPRDSEVLAFRDQFLRGVNLVIEAARSQRDIDALGPVITEVAGQFGEKSAEAELLRSALADRSKALVAAERERLAALSGTLILNATPWANVESVVEQGSGQAVDLGSDRATPLRLTVPEGTYRVTFRHPSESRPVVQVASVRAKQSQQVSAGFRNLSAEDYLKRVGYAN
ncbi:serine/threonine protein kinase [Pseudomarimonas salicorniae]|uniref:Protein kinase n=1 Tax=Pseudomarimonas salicorniae TaxID=2933270 RepID=A0ABT0GC96_9GAMM|nr:serine/threonine-protein kinase [Lysobacter sp. CAU 1642]MCK7592162.1 protein kinase [Lysobacter sp. CAU 1642]